MRNIQKVRICKFVIVKISVAYNMFRPLCNILPKNTSLKMVTKQLAETCRRLSGLLYLYISVYTLVGHFLRKIISDWSRTITKTEYGNLHLELSKRATPAQMYENRSESKERFAIQRYLLITGKKQNMQVLSHTFTYFSTQSPWTF